MLISAFWVNHLPILKREEGFSIFIKIISKNFYLSL